MHTARQLDVAHFGITVDGLPSSGDDVFPGWVRTIGWWRRG